MAYAFILHDVSRPSRYIPRLFGLASSFIRYLIKIPVMHYSLQMLCPLPQYIFNLSASSVRHKVAIMLIKYSKLGTKNLLIHRVGTFHQNFLNRLRIRTNDQVFISVLYLLQPLKYLPITFL